MKEWNDEGGTRQKMGHL